MEKGVYAARDADGSLYVYNAEPIRDEEEGVWMINREIEDSDCFEIHSSCFPNLLWDDDPFFISFDVKDPNAINFF